MTTTSRVVLVAAAALLVAVPSASALSARHATHHGQLGHHRHAARPDLVIGSMSLVVADGHVAGTVTVRNRGAATARRSVTGVLSSQRSMQELRTTRLRPGQHVTVPVSTTVPAGTTSITLCADATHRIRESRESNDCRTKAVVVTPTPATTPSIAAPTRSVGPHDSTGPVVY